MSEQSVEKENHDTNPKRYFTRKTVLRKVDHYCSDESSELKIRVRVGEDRVIEKKISKQGYVRHPNLRGVNSVGRGSTTPANSEAMPVALTRVKT